MNSSNILKTVLILLFVMNGVLLFQNLGLKAELESLSPEEIEKGNIIEDFSAKTLEGDFVSFNSQKEKYKSVFLYFHPSCHFCKKQMPYWNNLISKKNDKKYKFIGLTTDNNADSLKNYLNAYEATDWEVWIANKEDILDTKLSGTPTTFVLDNKGVVERVWVGEGDSKAFSEVEKYFSVKLDSHMN